MAYATAGVAYGAYEPFATLNAFTLSKIYTRAGLAAGAGVEWMVSERWSAKLEALYLDTGNLDGIDVPIVGTIHMRVRDAITRIGLNYHF
jgi:opacity protein-like surface antigen